MESNAERLARLEEQVESNRLQIETIKLSVAKCVTVERFRVVELIALGLTALVLVPVVSLIVSKVLIQ